MSHAAGSDQGRSAETGSAPITDVVKVFGKLLPRQLQDELALLKLELKDKEIDALKRQSEGLSREYNELCERYGATQPAAGSRKDK